MDLDRHSGVTNSCDIVKVKDTSFVPTEINDYTQFARVSQKID